MSQPQPTDARAAAAIAIVRAVAEVVKEVERAPAGVLYAALMTKGCTWREWTAISASLIASGLVKQEGDELVWVGPKE